MEIKILQIKASEVIRKEKPQIMGKLFVSSDMDSVDLDRYNYKEVYSGNFRLSEDVDIALEQLFEAFNCNRPSDYKGRSLSVSDIVFIESFGHYICDSFGWHKVDVTKKINSFFVKISNPEVLRTLGNEINIDYYIKLLDLYCISTFMDESSLSLIDGFEEIVPEREGKLAI